MQKVGIGIFVMVLLVGLAACGGAQATDAVSQGVTGDQNLAAAAGGGELSGLFQMAVGTLNLQGTENEVNVDTAGQLLVLWKAVRSLSSSDTVAADEIQGLTDQINETLTPAQIEAIEAMKLTPASLGEVMQKLGIDFGGGFSGQLSPEMQATRDARRASGDFPQGGGGGFRDGGEGGPPPGEGGGFGPAGQDMTPEQQATMEARFGQTRPGVGIPAPLIEALITYLEGIQ